MRMDTAKDSYELKKVNQWWSTLENDLFVACKRYQICQEPNRISYVKLPSILQTGPQCGLVALAMCMGERTTQQDVEVIITTAIKENFTCNGEMLSAQDMCQLARMFLPQRAPQLFTGDLSQAAIIDEVLFSGGLLLVPYDTDRNHAPCYNNGHKAHWAVVCGAFEKNGDVYVIAKHGKTKYLSFWNILQLAKSNSQLNEFSPERISSGIKYKLPHGGISGPLGLKNKCVLLQPEN